MGSRGINPLLLPFSTSPSQLLLRILLKLLLPRLSLLLLSRLPLPLLLLPLKRLLKGRGVVLTRKQPLLLSPLSFPTLMPVPTVLVLVFSVVFMLPPLVPFANIAHAAPTVAALPAAHQAALPAT